MSDFSPETDKLLELARGASALSEARSAQIKASLLSQIAAGGALSAAASHATWGKAAWLSSPLAKGISVLALLSAVGVGVYAGVRTPNQAPSTAPGSLPSALAGARAPSPAAADRPSEARAVPGANDSTPSSGVPNARDTGNADPNAAAQAPDTVVVTPPNPAAVSASGSKASTGVAHATPASEPTGGASAGTTADTLAEETGLLRDADQALRAGNAQRALALLDEHAARYPNGVLEPERSAERMIARCKLGQMDAKTAQTYLATQVNSPFAARLKDACSSVDR